MKRKRKLTDMEGSGFGSGTGLQQVKTGKLKRLADRSDKSDRVQTDTSDKSDALPPVSKWPKIRMTNTHGVLIELELESNVFVIDESAFQESFPDIGCDVLTVLKKADTYNLFANPVTEAIAPGYFSAIQQPMDISTMQMKLARNMYRSLPAFERDIYLMLHNATSYNPAGTAVHEVGVY